MANKTKHKRERRKRLRGHPLRGEDRRADAVTVAWMLSTLATALAELIGLVALWSLGGSRSGLGQPNLLATVPPLMFFTAATCGLVALCLTPIVYLFRRVPPPRIITVAAVLISVSPLVTLIVLSSLES